MPDPEAMLINEEDILSYFIYEVYGEQLRRKTEAIEKHQLEIASHTNPRS